MISLVAVKENDRISIIFNVYHLHYIKLYVLYVIYIHMTMHVIMIYKLMYLGFLARTECAPIDYLD